MKARERPLISMKPLSSSKYCYICLSSLSSSLSQSLSLSLCLSSSLSLHTLSVQRTRNEECSLYLRRICPGAKGQRRAYYSTKVPTPSSEDNPRGIQHERGRIPRFTVRHTVSTRRVYFRGALKCARAVGARSR